jgi:hypothetical protein
MYKVIRCQYFGASLPEDYPKFPRPLIAVGAFLVEPIALYFDILRKSSVVPWPE